MRVGKVIQWNLVLIAVAMQLIGCSNNPPARPNEISRQERIAIGNFLLDLASIADCEASDSITTSSHSTRDLFWSINGIDFRLQVGKNHTRLDINLKNADAKDTARLAPSWISNPRELERVVRGITQSDTKVSASQMRTGSRGLFVYEILLKSEDVERIFISVYNGFIVQIAAEHIGEMSEALLRLKH